MQITIATIQKMKSIKIGREEELPKIDSSVEKIKSNTPIRYDGKVICHGMVLLSNQWIIERDGKNEHTHEYMCVEHMNRWIGYACIEFAAIKNRFAHSGCQTDKHTWKWMGWKIEYGPCWQLWLYFECWFIVIVSLVWRCKMQIDSFDAMGMFHLRSVCVLFESECVFGCWSFHSSGLPFPQ